MSNRASHSPAWRERPVLVLPGLIAVVALLVGLALLPHRRAGDEAAAPAAALDHAAALDSAGDAVPPPPSPAVAAADTGSRLPPLPAGAAETELAVGPGQSLYDLLRARGVPHAQIMSLVRTCRPYRNLRRVHRGDRFRAVILDDGTLWRFRFDLADDESYIALQREGDAYRVFELTYPVERRVVGVAGRVGRSLYESLQSRGAPPVLATKLNDILGWEIDFRRDTRPDDHYRLLYEEVRRDGRVIRTGAVLAVTYVNRGRVHSAYRYRTVDGKTGYYDAAGHSLARQLMRAPLEYSRISSPFSLRRFHPVLKKWAPHYGVDYAAPVGTPVWAAGDGTVVEARYSRSNGRFVRIRHTNRSYESYYLHLSRFARGIRKGARVRQGQVIGYVGASGIATGPHLDFRVKKDGRWINPRTMKAPAARPVPPDELARFRATVALYGYSLAALPDEGGPLVLRDGMIPLHSPALPRPPAATLLGGMALLSLNP